MIRSRVGWMLIFVLLVLGAASFMVAAKTVAYGIPWWTLDNGGGVSAGGRYSLAGTIGQFDAGDTMRGGVYSLIGGYRGIAENYKLFLPLILRG